MSTNNSKRYVMVIDTKKCLGCKTCTAACCNENGIPDQSRAWHRVLETVGGNFPEYKKLYTPMPCMHCNNPPCVSYCPTVATFIDKDRSTVRIDYNRCVNCRKCIDICPYQARVANKSFDRSCERIIPEKYPYIGKCTFCIHRILEAESDGSQIGTSSKKNDNDKVVLPACVQECCGFARYFGDLNDKESEVYQILQENKERIMVLKEEEKTEPNVFYLI